MLVENNCAVHRVAERFPAVCAMELALFRKVLRARGGGHPGVAHHGRRRHLHLPHPFPPRRPPLLTPPPDLVAAAAAVAAVLAPAAEATDQAEVVPRSNLRLLADAGLCSTLLEVPPAIVREVQETLAGACGVTFFVWEQHHSPVRMLAAGVGHRRPDGDQAAVRSSCRPGSPSPTCAGRAHRRWSPAVSPMEAWWSRARPRG